MSDTAARTAAADLGSALGHAFADAGAVQRALTHRSAARAHNERLEFLGDAALELAVAELLFVRYPAASEGGLTRARAALVSNETLAAAARAIGVGPYLVLGAGELRNGGRERDTILAGAFEALLGVMYLEAGHEAVRRAVERIFGPRLDHADPDRTAKDAKTRLQELLQARGLELPRYRIVKVSGKAHRPRFLVECRLDAAGVSATHGEGPSRRQAEQRAAERALAEMGNDG